MTLLVLGALITVVAAWGGLLLGLANYFELRRKGKTSLVISAFYLNDNANADTVKVKIINKSPFRVTVDGIWAELDPRLHWRGGPIFIDGRSGTAIDMTVPRRMTKNGVRLKVKTAVGEKFTSPKIFPPA